MNPFNKTTLVAALPLPLLAGCMTPGEDDPNRRRWWRATGPHHYGGSNG